MIKETATPRLSDASMTEVGDLEGPVGRVDARGTVRLDGVGWRVEWAIGAEDRWHVATHEIAVRQELLDETPVPSTAMRVPGGDVVHRAAGLSDGRGRAVMIEVENRTATPVSLALAVRADRPGAIRSLSIEGDRVIVDGRVAMNAGRPPGATVAIDHGDVWPVVMAGPGRGDRSVIGSEGSASGAVIVAVPHRQVVQVVVPVSGEIPARADSAAIATGWRAMADRGALFDVDDPAAMTRWRRAVPALILAAGSSDLERAAAAAPVLDLLGLADEADRARSTVLGALDDGRLHDEGAARGAVALASRRLRSVRESGLAELVAVLVDRAGPAMTALDLGYVADALEAEDSRAAGDVRRIVASSAATKRATPLVGELGRFLADLVDESVDRIDLLPGPPADWIGQSIDVRGLATRHGVVSYSVRWHDRLPALLWEVGASTPVEITCSGLDPTWTTMAPSGEALLNASR